MLLVPDYPYTFIKEGGITEGSYTVSILVYVKGDGFVVNICLKTRIPDVGMMLSLHELAQLPLRKETDGQTESDANDEHQEGDP